MKYWYGMMQGNYFHLKDWDSQRQFLHDYIKSRSVEILDAGNEVSITVQEYKSPRSLSANALYWVWMTELSKLFNSRQLKIEYYHNDGSLAGYRDYDKEDCHDLMKSMFLGYEQKKLSKTELKVLKSTKRLNSAEFCHYMTQIQQWAIDKLRHTLSDPMESEYRRYIERQNQ